MKLNELHVRRVGVTTAAQEVAKLVKGDKPVMLMLIGLPASGKSTFRDKLEDELKKIGEKMFTIASTDDMIDEAAKALGLSYTQAYRTIDRDEIEKKFHGIIRDSVKNEQAFLIDRTNLSIKNRRPHMVNTSDKFLKVAVAFEIDPKVQAQRLKQRAEKTGKHIPEDVIKQMKNDYVAPTHEEGFDEIIFVS